MSVVETERDGAVLIIRMNRPERMNALGTEMRAELAEAFVRVQRKPRARGRHLHRHRARLLRRRGHEGIGRARHHQRRSGIVTRLENPYQTGKLEKPVIAAINGFAMGGGFMQAERADLRVAVQGAVFEMSEAKRWLLGGYNHGFIGGISHAVATEMAFAFRFTSERLYELGLLNRLVEADELIPTAREMAAHLMTLPPASRVNTLMMMRTMRPQRQRRDLTSWRDRLKQHGARSDLMESRQAFAEKRTPNFKGWDDPEDRYRTPTLEDIRARAFIEVAPS